MSVRETRKRTKGSTVGNRRPDPTRQLGVFARRTNRAKVAPHDGLTSLAKALSAADPSLQRLGDIAKRSLENSRAESEDRARALGAQQALAGKDLPEDASEFQAEGYAISQGVVSGRTEADALSNEVLEMFARGEITDPEQVMELGQRRAAEILQGIDPEDNQDAMFADGFQRAFQNRMLSTRTTIHNELFEQAEAERLDVSGRATAVLFEDAVKQGANVQEAVHLRTQELRAEMPAAVATQLVVDQAILASERTGTVHLLDALETRADGGPGPAKSQKHGPDIQAARERILNATETSEIVGWRSKQSKQQMIAQQRAERGELGEAEVRRRQDLDTKDPYHIPSGMGNSLIKTSQTAQDQAALLHKDTQTLGSGGVLPHEDHEGPHGEVTPFEDRLSAAVDNYVDLLKTNNPDLEDGELTAIRHQLYANNGQVPSDYTDGIERGLFSTNRETAIAAFAQYQDLKTRAPVLFGDSIDATAARKADAIEALTEADFSVDEAFQVYPQVVEKGENIKRHLLGDFNTRDRIDKTLADSLDLSSPSEFGPDARVRLREEAAELAGTIMAAGPFTAEQAINRAVALISNDFARAESNPSGIVVSRREAPVGFFDREVMDQFRARVMYPALLKHNLIDPADADAPPRQIEPGTQVPPDQQVPPETSAEARAEATRGFTLVPTTDRQTGEKKVMVVSPQAVFVGTLAIENFNRNFISLRTAQQNQAQDERVQEVVRKQNERAKRRGKPRNRLGVK